MLWCFFTIWFWLGYPLEVPSQDPSYHYLLSALSQGMAALLGLTFTISLVGAQLTARYSQRLPKRLFSPLFVLYICLFAIAVVLPLIFLPSPNPWKVKLCLTLGVLDLVLLVPYFYYFLDRLSPRSLIEALFQESAKEIKAGKERGQVESVQTMDNIAMSALGFKDYDTFSLALEKLGELMLLRTNNEQEKIRDLLADICHVAIEDPRAARVSTEALSQLCQSAAQRGRKEVAKRALEILEGEIGLVAIRERQGKVAVFAVSAAAKAIKSLAEAAVEEIVSDLTLRVILTFEVLGINAAEKGLWKPVFDAASALIEVGADAFTRCQDTIALQAAKALQKMKAKAGTGEEAVTAAILSKQGEKAVDKFLKNFHLHI